MANEHIKAHEYSSNNNGQLEQDEVCGCFYCLSIFNPEEIEEWIDDGDSTAVCPYCGMDSVIGESSDYPITKTFLGKMKDYWF